MKRFVMQCRDRDFTGSIVVAVKELSDHIDGPTLRVASEELATHMVSEHGLSEDDPWWFRAVEVTEIDGHLWVTEVVGAASEHGAGGGE